MIAKILAMVACIVMSGYFSATETAFSSLNKNRLRVLSDQGSRRAALTLALSEDYDKLISTILIGNNIVNIAVASIGTVLFIDLAGQELGPTISTAVVTIVVLIFGEITPKSLAKDYPESFAMFSAPIINGILWLFTPLNFLFTQWKKLVSRLFRSSEDSKMSQEELLILLDEVQQDGAIDEDDGILLKNAIEFGSVEAQDILTPRVDLTAIPVTATRQEIIDYFDNSHFSRLPVYNGSLDQIVGVLHRNDFYLGGGITEKPLEQVMTPPLFIHPTEKIDHLLQIFRSTKSHLAVVVDEYGGTMGLVTVEDILEELVGEIWDEHDLVEEPLKQISQDTFRVEGSWGLDDFCTQFDLKIDSESLTVGGWIMDHLARIPRNGDSFLYQDLKISVESAREHRVESILVTVPEQN